MAKVVIMDHPLIQHKIGYIRSCLLYTSRCV